MKPLKIAVVGATGAVGRVLLDILKQREFPVGELVPLASPRSVGKPVSFSGQQIPCQAMEKGCFDGVDLAFFDASDAVSKEWVPHAAEAGAWVVDNSASFRMSQEVPLLVPEVNGELLEKRLALPKLMPQDRVIAGPNCSTVQLVVALKPILEKWGLKRVVVSSYQSTSGAGTAAMQELLEQTRSLLGNDPIQVKAFSHRIGFNVIPQIGGFKGDGYTSEETKIIEESRKILSLPSLKITATAVRVPTLSCHGESVNVETERPFEISEIREALQAQAGVVVQDDPARNLYPLNQAAPGDLVEAASGRDAVYVGRIRRDSSLENGLNLWVVSDNLRKGAALNAVQIGEVLVQRVFG